ncbi:membrane protein insertion efficiency factor YidD [Mycobacterium sp.]|uniref:membrane protein insertion efficiency factor YidD n=1 Tax=Mycobacterium sp. TaxID=1785 RepID=UPI0039C9A663
MAMAARQVRHMPVRCAIFAIELYRTYVSPMRLPTCRFTPTCSQYAVEALTEYGLIRGGWLAAVRLAKCGPWHRGGWDPIPERRGRTTASVTGSSLDPALDPALDDVGGTPPLRGESESRV